uniref:Uncharacterized protein n=1 Tax=Knipowitschia caucasica TaxID=637954 RepID=A0AAV2M573_KNICA
MGSADASSSRGHRHSRGKKPNIETRLLCILKALCVYLNEDPEDLVKTYMDADVGAEKEFEKVVLGVYIVEHQHADASDSLEDFGIIIDGIAVLQDLKHIPTGWALLLGLIYCLDMNSRKGLGCTFEFIPKMDGPRHTDGQVHRVETEGQGHRLMETDGQEHRLMETDRQGHRLMETD